MKVKNFKECIADSVTTVNLKVDTLDQNFLGHKNQQNLKKWRLLNIK